VSSSLGVVIGGVLTEALGWRWIFVLNVPIGLVVVAVTARQLPRDAALSRRPRVDWLGSLSSVLGAGLICFSFARATSSAWGDSWTLSSLGAALFVLVLFVVHERRAAAPLVPLSLFRNYSVAGANIASVLVGTGMLGMFYFISLYEQQVLRVSPLEAGLAYLPLTVVLAVAAFLAPPLVARLGIRAVVAAGCVVAGAGLGVFATAAPSRGLWADIIGPSLIVAPGLALTFIPLTLAAVAGVPNSHNGIAAGLVNASRSTGSAVGLAAVATLASSGTASVARSGRPALDALSDGFRLGFGVSAVAMVAAAVAGTVLFRHAPAAAGTAASGTRRPRRLARRPEARCADCTGHVDGATPVGEAGC
jgi:MFS family permease